MSPTDWNDDEQEPPAPLPAHERVWRHPSELGEQAWRQTEPPLAIGRGLTAATGVVGSVLGVMLLWAMLSTEAGRGAVATARSTIVTLTQRDFGTELADDASTSSVAATPTSLADIGSASSLPRRPVSTVSGITGEPMPTWALRPAAAATNDSTPSTNSGLHPTVLAVPVSRGTLAITTAAAVADSVSVQLELPDGQRSAARVLFVDDRSGLAVLAPQSVRSTAAFTIAKSIEPGDQLTFLGDRSMTVTVGADGSITGEWANDDAMPEGAPVVNQRGELVALCTHEGRHSVQGTTTTTSIGAAPEHLVTLETLDEIQQAMTAFRGSSPVWLGVVINDDPAGVLSVGAVDPSGPAYVAGLMVGDVIIALDGTTIADGHALVTQLAQHRPGDVVRFTIRRADGTTVEVSVTLASPKTAV